MSDGDAVGTAIVAVVAEVGGELSGAEAQGVALVLIESERAAVVRAGALPAGQTVWTELTLAVAGAAAVGRAAAVAGPWMASALVRSVGAPEPRVERAIAGSEARAGLLAKLVGEAAAWASEMVSEGLVDGSLVASKAATAGARAARAALHWWGEGDAAQSLLAVLAVVGSKQR